MIGMVAKRVGTFSRVQKKIVHFPNLILLRLKGIKIYENVPGSQTSAYA